MTTTGQETVADRSRNISNCYVSTIATDEQLDRLSTLGTQIRLNHEKNNIQAMWRRAADELNGMIGSTRGNYSPKFWYKTYNKLVRSVQFRMERLRMCERDSSVEDRDKIVDTLNTSWKPWDRRIIDSMPGPMNKYRRLDKPLWRVCGEQNEVLLMFMHRWPELRPKPRGDDVDVDDTSHVDLAASESHRWLQLTSILNVMGAKHSPSEWRKYVNKTRDELLAQASTETDTNAELPFQKQRLEPGLAQLLWPNRFGVFTPIVQPKPKVTKSYRFRTDRCIQIQIDLIAHFLQHNPAMWYAKPKFNANNVPKADWLLLVDVLNIVGKRRTSVDWHQFLSRLVHGARTVERYKMTWFERQLSELWNGGAVLTLAPSSVDRLLCADIYRTDAGQLWYICRLCNKECASETQFRGHCRSSHGLNVECVAKTVEELPAAECKLKTPDEQTPTPGMDIVVVPVDIKKITNEHNPAPEPPIFVDTGTVPLEIKLEVDADMVSVIKEEPAFVDESLAELASDGAQVEFTWRYIDAVKTPSAATASRLPFTCDICKSQFKQKLSLVKHINQHVRLLNKTGADLSKSDKTSVVLHKKSSTRCLECEQTFVTRAARDAHFHSVHMIPLDMAIATAYTFVAAAASPGRSTSPPSARFICSECAAHFKLQSELRQHYMEQHGLSSMIRFDEQNGRVSDAIAIKPPQGAHYRCNLCGYARAQRGLLNKHMWTHSTAESFICSRCPYRGRTRNNLTHHRKTVHSGDLARLACEFCDFWATERFVMERHRRLHTGERPFVCTVAHCGQAFRIMQTLRHHFMCSHYEGPAAYECRVCDERFVSEGHRQRHTRKEHPEVPLKLKFRRRVFESKAQTSKIVTDSNK